eukprot:1369513-Prymnesium_polylepis.2
MPQPANAAFSGSPSRVPRYSRVPAHVAPCSCTPPTRAFGVVVHSTWVHDRPQDVCCSCGGGSWCAPPPNPQPPIAPPPLPPPSPPSPPLLPCHNTVVEAAHLVDSVLHDWAVGYVACDYFLDKRTMCDRYRWMDAEPATACCACGGGIHVQPPPLPPSSPPPRSPPLVPPHPPPRGPPSPPIPPLLPCHDIMVDVAHLYDTVLHEWS